jgi:outer membrane protein assembly factor BamB
VRKLTPLVIAAATMFLAGCWTQVGFGPDRAGFNPFETTIDPTNVQQLEPAWSVDVGDSTNAPIVVGATVFTTSNGVATALNATTGAQRWRTPVEEPTSGDPVFFGPPTFNGTNVVATAGYLGLGGNYTFDPATGTPNGSLTFHHGETGSIASNLRNASSVVTFDYGSGGPFLITLRYAGQSGLIDFTGCCGTNTPTDTAIVGRHVLVGYGASVLSYPIGPCTQVPPPFPGGYCEPEWSTSVGAGPSTPVGIGHGFVAAGNANGELVVLDLATGAEQWRSKDVTGPLTAPASDGTHVFVGTGGGRVDVYDIDGCGQSTCAPRWSNVLFAPAAGQPAIANGLVYATTTDGHVRAFDATGCATPPCTALWSERPSTSALTAPVVAKGGVYVVTSDGAVVAYRLPT